MAKSIAPSIASTREAALAGYEILDTEAEGSFDDIVKAAAAACGMPVSLVSLLDVDRQWFKARVGFEPSETSLASSICAHAVESEGVFEIPDTTQDPRTADNPLVTGDPHVRFYAGAPLRTADGTALGTLCVLDTKPNRLSADQVLILRTLSNLVMTQLELRRALRERGRIDRLNAAILESAVDYAIVSMDLEGRVTSWSPGSELILGWTEAEMCGEYASRIFTPEDTAAGIPEKEMGAALLHGRGNDERWHVKKDGTRFWANGEIMPLKDEHGTPVGFIKILRDRTGQRLEAEERRADAEFMRSVLASSADCIKVLDLDTKLIFLSDGGLRAMEVSDFNAINGCSWPDFWSDKGHRDAHAAVEAAKSGRTGHFQGAASTLAGTPKWWDVQVTPIRDAAGRPEKLLVVSRDITSQKSYERQIEASEELWRSLFDGMQEGFFIGEVLRDGRGRAVDYRFIEINRAFAAQSGLPPDSAGRTIRALVPEIQQSLIDAYARAIDSGEAKTFEIHVAALERWFEVRARRLNGDRFTCLFLDITARKGAEARRTALLELGDWLRDLTAKADIAAAAGKIMGQTLTLSRAGYGAVDHDRETVFVVQDWIAPGLVSLNGSHAFRSYGSYIEDLKLGRPVIIDDVARDPRTAADAAVWREIGAGGVVNLPVIEHGRFVALFFMTSAEPRAWTEDDVGFLRNVADRTRAAVARAEAEEQQRMLNLELSHRMKNMLAMVQSIATQTMRTASDVDTAKEVLAGRLIALGKSHDLLIGGGIGSTSLLELAESTLQPHRDNQDRFLVHGPEVRVGAKAAMSLALILHELATNAAKYGALLADRGQVSVVWTVVGDEVDPTVCLRWVETGGPPVVAPARKGFGSRLIDRGLAGTFGGSAALSYPPTGVTCTITASQKGLQVDDLPPLP